MKMGLENEDFIGNPNKIEYTDDELEYEYYEAGDIDMGEELVAEPYLNNLMAGLEDDDDDDDEDEDWYDEVDEDEEGESDFEVDDDDIDNFLSESSEPELRMRLVNGVFVPSSSSPISSNEETEEPTEGNDIDNNEVVKTGVAATTPSSENDADTGQNPPP